MVVLTSLDPSYHWLQQFTILLGYLNAPRNFSGLMDLEKQGVICLNTENKLKQACRQPYIRAKPKGLELMAVIKGGLELNKNDLITRNLTT